MPILASRGLTSGTNFNDSKKRRCCYLLLYYWRYCSILPTLTLLIYFCLSATASLSASLHSLISCRMDSSVQATHGYYSNSHQTLLYSVPRSIRSSWKRTWCKSDSWFCPVNNVVRSTRSTADPLTLRSQAARLEERKKFFFNRVAGLKKAKTVRSFKNAHAYLRANMVESM